MLSDPVSEVDRPVQEMIARLAKFLERKVKTLSMTARPDFTTREAMDVFVALLRSATSRRQTAEEFALNAAQVTKLAADDDSYYAKMIRAYAMPHRSWLMVNERRHQMRLLWERFFEDWDVFLCPVMGTPPPRIGYLDPVNVPAPDIQIRNGEIYPFPAPFNFTGQPSISLPLGQSREGLPIGMMFSARYADEATLIRLAAQLEQACPWRDRRAKIGGPVDPEQT